MGLPLGVSCRFLVWRGGLTVWVDVLEGGSFQLELSENVLSGLGSAVGIYV